ncbi:putative ATP-synthase-associated protein [Helianthus debilis subsp. tardiflorus]
MGSSEKETKAKTMKGLVAFCGSFLITMVGGFVLLLWEIKYHPSNSQLWMVPFGLIMFLTPVLACLASFISDAFTPTNSQHA